MAKKAEALTIEELKALCRFFHEKGALNTDFEMEFNTLMQGKYEAAIKQKAFDELINQMQQSIDKGMEDFDMQHRLQQGLAIQELAKFVITA